jgi:hypothetical protein
MARTFGSAKFDPTDFYINKGASAHQIRLSLGLSVYTLSAVTRNIISEVFASPDDIVIPAPSANYTTCGEQYSGTHGPGSLFAPAQLVRVGKTSRKGWILLCFSG